MHSAQTPLQQASRTALDVLIRAGLIVILAVACYRIFNPFLGLMVWATILAVALYPLQAMLARRLAGRNGLAASLIVLLLLLIMLLPTVMIGKSVAESTHAVAQRIETGQLHISPPPPGVREWPVIGPRVAAAWQQASSDMSGLLEKSRPEITALAKSLLRQAAGMGAGILTFAGAIVIAGIMMAHAEGGARTAVRVLSRVTGPLRGPQLTHLSSTTIRAVAQGVIGIAFIQALLLGIGFIVAGVPFAGLLVLAVLLLGIVQLPVMLVTLPAIVYMYTTEMSTVAFAVFTAYSVVAGLADNVLKPLLLGRGVPVPMPVILIGAIGGMVGGGIVGLFIGPVTLALGYELFMAWVDEVDEIGASPEAGDEVPVAVADATEA
jgi:predicted PurR-regulated permease PerM